MLGGPLRFYDIEDVPSGNAGTVNAVHFDGSNDWLERTGDLLNEDVLNTALGHNYLIVSLWFNIDSSLDGSGVGIMEMDWEGLSGLEFRLARASSGIIAVSNRSVTLNSSSSVSSGSWHHVLFYDSPKLHQAVLYIDGSFETSAHTGNAYNFSSNDPFESSSDIKASIGWEIDETGGTKYLGDLAEIYINSGTDLTELDATQIENRRLFITSSGKPTDLGTNGENPTGSSPPIYLGNDFNSFETNLGTIGDFTVNGALTAASTSPSD